MATDSKKINATTMNFAMRYGILKIRRELREQFDNYPEDSSGVEIKYSDLEEKLELLIADGLGYVEELLGATPEIDEDALDAYKEDLDTKEEIEVDSGVLVQRETFRTHWDAHRGRQIAFMRREVAYYGVPIEFTLTGGGNAHISVQHLSPVTVGDATFTIVDDMHFGGNNPNKAEFMAPASCTEEVTVTVRFNKWGTNSSTPTEESTGYNSIHVVKNIRKVGNRTWERFGPTTNQPGSIFGENITVKWPECGKELFVPNGAVDYAPNGSADAAWICGTMSPADESQGQTGGVWGPAGCTASYYEIHYNK